MDHTIDTAVAAATEMLRLPSSSAVPHCAQHIEDKIFEETPMLVANPIDQLSSEGRLQFSMRACHPFLAGGGFIIVRGSDRGGFGPRLAAPSKLGELWKLTKDDKSTRSGFPASTSRPRSVIR